MDIVTAMDHSSVDPSTSTTATVETNNTAPQDPLDTALADQQQPKDYDSSDLELSSSDDDDSSSEDEQHADRNDDNDDDGDDDDGGEPSGIPKSKNELTDIPIEQPTVKEITEDMVMVTIGQIVNVLDKTVVVQQDAWCSSTVLDMGSLLVFAEDRHVLGEVFETFGPVESPFYSVRFNTVDNIDPVRTKKGARIGYVPTYERTQLVQVEQLKLMKGTDASNQYDEEVGADELEFSDDEKEMEYRRQTKKKGKQNQGHKQQQRGPKRPLEDAIIPDGRRPLQSYADIAATATTSSMHAHRQQQKRSYASVARQAPPPPPSSSTSQQQQHPDPIAALLDSYMTSRPAMTRTPTSSSQIQPHQQSSQPPAPSPSQKQTQPPPPPQQQQQQQQQTQPPPSQQQTQQEQQQPPTLQRQPSSIFQSIRALFSRAPPPS